MLFSKRIFLVFIHYLLLAFHMCCWGAWDATCGHKARDTTPSIAWRREALKEEALNDLLWEDEKDPSSISRPIHIGTVSKATLEKVLGDGVARIWASPSAYITSWSKLNWTIYAWPSRIFSIDSIFNANSESDFVSSFEQWGCKYDHFCVWFFFRWSVESDSSWYWRWKLTKGMLPAIYLGGIENRDEW